MALALTQIGALYPAQAADGGLLQALYGVGKPKAGNPVLALRQAERDRARDVARTEARVDVARDIAAFRAGVARAADPTGVLRDAKVMKVLLTANGLADQLPYAALARKALLADVNDPNSLVNRVADTRWKTTATLYDFAHKGMAVLSDPKVLDTLASAYAEVTWRRELDKATPGLSDALSFRENASKATSALAILGDPVLRRVVTTTLGLPLQIAFQSVEAQERAITSRLDVAKLGDAAFVEKFTQRYLIARASQPHTASETDPLSQLRRSAGLIV